MDKDSVKSKNEKRCNQINCLSSYLAAKLCGNKFLKNFKLRQNIVITKLSGHPKKSNKKTGRKLLRLQPVFSDFRYFHFLQKLSQSLQKLALC